MPGTNRFRLYHKALNAIDPYFRLGIVSNDMLVVNPDPETSRKSSSAPDPFNFDKNKSDSRRTIRLCNMCQRSIKPEKLLSCDFCPLAYHADCIFELADAVPNVKEKFWMCPCHAEHLIDQKLLKSDQLTERIKLWSRFRVTEADFDRIKRDFFDKCRHLRQWTTATEITSNTNTHDSLNMFSAQTSHIPDEIVGIYSRSYQDPPDKVLTEADVSHLFIISIEPKMHENDLKIGLKLIYQRFLSNYIFEKGFLES